MTLQHPFLVCADNNSNIMMMMLIMMLQVVSRMRKESTDVALSPFMIMFPMTSEEKDEGDDERRERKHQTLTLASDAHDRSGK